MSLIKHILVIDDDPDALLVLEEYLRLEGYNVTTAPDGSSGIHMLTANEVQLVITDLNMPGISGMDVVEIVRKNYPEIPVIVITGYGTEETVLEALRKGAIDYLAKPFLLEILKLSLRKAEGQLKINRRVRELEESAAKQDMSSFLEILPHAFALVTDEGRIAFCNNTFEKAIGNGQDGVFASVNKNNKSRIVQFIQQPEAGNSIVLESFNTRNPGLVMELNFLPLKTADDFWLLHGEEIQWDGDTQVDVPEEAVFLVSLDGMLLWADSCAMELFDFNINSNESVYVSDFLLEKDKTRIELLLDKSTPITTEDRWISSLPEDRRDFSFKCSPVIDSSEVRAAIVVQIRQESQETDYNVYNRKQLAGEVVPLLIADSTGKIISASQALTDKLVVQQDLLIGQQIKDYLNSELDPESNLKREVLQITLDNGDMASLVLSGKYCLEDEQIFQFGDGGMIPLASRIEMQKKYLARASSVLQNLIHEDEADKKPSLKRSLDNVAQVLVNTERYKKAILYLRLDDTQIIWSFAGLSTEDASLIKGDPKWIAECENPTGVQIQIGSAVLVCSAEQNQQNWQDGDVLLLPIVSRDGQKVGFLRLEGYVGSSIPNLAEIQLVELVLRQITFVLDEIRLENRIKHSEAKYQDLYENARYSILIIDIENGRILDSNQEAQQLTGYNQDELAGRKVWDLRPNEFQDTARRNWIKSVRREQSSFENIPMKKKDGSTIYVEYDCMYSEFEGRPVMQIFYRDITDKQALEFSLIQSQKLAGLGQLSAGIAHELRNPLGIINSSLYFINTTVDRERLQVGDQIAKHLKIIKNEVERSRKIIENLLSFSRLSTQERESVDINNLLNVTVELVRKELLVNNIQLSTEFSNLPNVNLNLDELKQAFLNIILNATQAMPDGGSLRITSRIDGERIQLCFIDSGDGIRKEDLANVLNPFFTTKDPGVGTGLGLSLTHTFIRRSGGNLSIESEPGSGTTVRIFLPSNFTVS
jgi:PAS domain S-box-containing protein